MAIDLHYGTFSLLASAQRLSNSLLAGILERILGRLLTIRSWTELFVKKAGPFSRFPGVNGPAYSNHESSRGHIHSVR